MEAQTSTWHKHNYQTKCPTQLCLEQCIYPIPIPIRLTDWQSYGHRWL